MDIVSLVLAFLSQHLATILAAAILIIGWAVSSNIDGFKQLAAAVFLDIEKETIAAALKAGPDQFAAALKKLMGLIPARYQFALTVLAFLFGTTPDKLAAKIAQAVYDELRSKTVVKTGGGIETAK